MPEATPKPAPVLEIVPPPTSQLELFLEHNIKKILVGVTLLAVVLLTLAISRHFKHQTELEAAERFTSASTIEDCDVVIAKYAGTPAAGNALLLKAELLWNEGKKESSTDVLKEFVKNESSHPLHAAALLALGSKQMSLGDKEAANQTFEAFKKSHAESELLPAVDIYTADILWADGKADEAKTLLEGMLSKYPGKMSAFTAQVDERVKMINAGLPQTEVDAPPAPKPPANLVPSPLAPIPGLPGAPLSAPSLLTPPSAPALPSAPVIPVPTPPAPAPAPESSAAPAPAPVIPVPVTPPAPSVPAVPAPVPAPAPEASAAPATPAPAAPVPAAQ